jgi:hypothetical protein
MAAVSAGGSTVCVLMRRLNSSCSRSMALVLRALQLGWRQPGEGEQAVAGFLQAVGNSAMLEPPFADESTDARVVTPEQAFVPHTDAQIRVGMSMPPCTFSARLLGEPAPTAYGTSGPATCPPSGAHPIPAVSRVRNRSAAGA